MKPATTKTIDPSITKLEEAFGIFNQVSAHLSHSYQNLELKVASLKEELAASNSARIRELTEKERLAATLSTLMEALPGGVVVLDDSGSVKEMNPAARALIGPGVIGENWELVLREMASEDPIYGGEFSLNDGNRVSVTSSPFGDGSEKIVLITDITENHRLNAQINRDKRLAALGEMAARLAHQVRTPLSSAVLYLSNLSARVKAGDHEACGRTVKTIQTQLDQIEMLVEGMLGYIKGDMCAMQTFSPIALLEQVQQATALQVSAAGGRLGIRFSCDEFRMHGDREALFNALCNLVVNALQAQPQAPEIAIGLDRDADCIRFSVTDNGPGIDQAIRDRIFDPFFSTRPGGTGLGLAVVMSAVNAHQGEITIDDAPGCGTIFTLTIPGQGTVDKTGSAMSPAGVAIEHGF